MRVLFFLLFLPAFTWGQSTDNGWKDPGAAFGSGSWSDVDSMKASDDRYATNSGAAQNVATLTTYGHGIPTDATVDSIIVSLEGFCNDNQGPDRDMAVTLYRDGAAAGDTIEIRQGKTDGLVEGRGFTNGLWGATWTAAQINSTNTGIQLWVEQTDANDHEVDHFKMKVWYTEAAEGKPQKTVFRTH